MQLLLWRAIEWERLGSFYTRLLFLKVNSVSPSSIRHYYHLETLHVCVCEELMCHFILIISFSKIQHHLRHRVVRLIGSAEVESNAVGVSPYYFKDVRSVSEKCGQGSIFVIDVEQSAIFSKWKMFSCLRRAGKASFKTIMQAQSHMPPTLESDFLIERVGHLWERRL